MPKKKEKPVVEEVSVATEEVPELKEEPKKVESKKKKKAEKKYPSPELVKDSEGRSVEGFVSADGKSVTDLKGVTFAL